MSTDSWSSSLSCFCETFAVTIDISKAFDRVWQKSLLSKLLSYGFYSSLCTFISSFLLGCSISAVLDGHCSKPKSISNGILQGSVLPPTRFLLFMNDLSKTTMLMTLPCITPIFRKRPKQQELSNLNSRGCRTSVSTM